MFTRKGGGGGEGRGREGGRLRKEGRRKEEGGEGEVFTMMGGGGSLVPRLPSLVPRLSPFLAWENEAREKVYYLWFLYEPAVTSGLRMPSKRTYAPRVRTSH